MLDFHFFEPGIEARETRGQDGRATFSDKGDHKAPDCLVVWVLSCLAELHLEKKGTMKSLLACGLWA